MAVTFVLIVFAGQIISAARHNHKRLRPGALHITSAMTRPAVPALYVTRYNKRLQVPICAGFLSRK
jgi:hypothetical protein